MTLYQKKTIETGFSLMTLHSVMAGALRFITNRSDDGKVVTYQLALFRWLTLTWGYATEHSRRGPTLEVGLGRYALEGRINIYQEGP